MLYLMYKWEYCSLSFNNDMVYGIQGHINELVQDCNNSIANILELPWFCTKALTWFIMSDNKSHSQSLREEVWERNGSTSATQVNEDILEINCKQQTQQGTTPHGSQIYMYMPDMKIYLNPLCWIYFRKPLYVLIFNHFSKSKWCR